MANEANIRAVITADDRASRVLQKFGENTDKASDSILKSFAKIAAAFVTIQGASILVGDAIKRVDTLANANRAFENMGFSANATKDMMTALNKSILGLPTSLDAAVRNVELLASSTNDIGRSQKIFQALNDGIIGFGGTADQVNTAVIQLSQAFAGGRVMAQDWNSMLNAGLGPALNAIAKQMGITTSALRDGLSDGSISVSKFQDALIQLDQKGGGGMASLQKIAHDSTKGISTSIENAKTAVVRGLADIINAIGTNNIANAITNIGKVTETVLKGMVVNVKEVQSAFSDYLAPGLERFVQIIGEVVNIIEKAFRPSLEALWNTISARLLPQLIQLWNTLEPGLTEALKVISVAVGVILVGAMWVLINTLNFTISIFGGLIRAIGDVIGWVGNMGGAFINFAKGIPRAFSGVANAIAAPFKFAFDEIARFWNATVGKLHFNAPSWVPGLGGKGWDMPSLPVLDTGGIVSKPTIAMLAANSKPEAIIPLDKAGSMGGVNITVQAGALMGSDIEARKFAKLIFDHLSDYAGSKNMTVAQMIGV